MNPIDNTSYIFNAFKLNDADDETVIFINV